MSNLGGVRIGANIPSLNAQRRLEDSTDRLAATFQRLSTGQRINRASDDAAGLFVASTLNVSSKVFAQGVRNLNDGISALNIADQAIASLSQVVVRQRELAEQSSNGIYSEEQREALNSEAQALRNEYQRILSTTEFNDRQLLDGSLSSLMLQAGFGTDGVLAADLVTEEQLFSITATGLGTYTTEDISGWSSSTLVGDAQLLVGDINNDGIDDIVALQARRNPGIPPNSYVDVGLFLGEADGSGFSLADMTSVLVYSDFGVPTTIDIQAQLVDTNGDGYLDIKLMADDDRNGAGTDKEGIIKSENGGTALGALKDGPLSTLTDEVGTSVTGDFNGDGVTDTAIVKSGDNFLISVQDTEQAIEYGDISASLDQQSFSLLTTENALLALDYFDLLSERLSSARADIGASLSRISTATNVLQASVENYKAAESRIVDADIAQESAELVRQQILNQTTAAVLGQANQQPALALSLLGDA